MKKGQIHWRWQKYINADGYGRLKFLNVSFIVHRVSFFVFTDIKKIEIEERIRHKCRFTDCVNPDHLEIGTIQDNQNDKIRDGTHKFGETVYSAKITDEIAKEIKLSKGQGVQSDRAERFGVSLYTVQRIDKGSAWTHV